MAKSQETFGKKEKEKKKLQQRKDKEEKRDERKANAKKGMVLEDMMAYVDENGNLVSTPPDPKRKIVYKQEDIQIAVPKHTDEIQEVVRTGSVVFYNDAKGFGFIKDSQTQESIFVHANQLTEMLKENDKVTFEVEMGMKGPVAVKVAKIKAV